MSSQNEKSVLPSKKLFEWSRCAFCHKGIKRSTGAICAIVEPESPSGDAFVLWAFVAKERCGGSRSICKECFLDFISGRRGRVKVKWMGEYDEVSEEAIRRGIVYQNIAEEENAKGIGDRSNKCPFCFGEDLSIDNAGFAKLFIVCHTCGAQGPMKPTIEAAIDEWNNIKDDKDSG